METIADRIKYARKHAGLTQQGLGDALGVTRNAVSLWESGTNCPTADKLGSLANLTGISVGWLYSGGPLDQNTGLPRQKVDDELSAYVDGLTGENRKKALAILKVAIGADPENP